jgi:hypothetical protein
MADDTSIEPAACPFCGGTDITTYMVEWSAFSKEDPQNRATLHEHQCNTCDGCSFWS